MRASTPFDGSECCVPLLEECMQHHGHKEDPGVMPDIGLRGVCFGKSWGVLLLLVMI